MLARILSLMPRRSIKIGHGQVALDARPDRLDLRDRAYAPTLGSLPHRWPSEDDARRWLPAYAAADMLLDQGSDGACTGFGLAAVIDYLLFLADLKLKSAGKPSKQSLRRVSPAMLYELARLYDEWPGEDYEGSSCRGALKGWQRHGVCGEALWPYRLDRDGKRVFVAPLEDEANRDEASRNWDLDALRTTIGVYYRIDARSIVDMQAAIYETGAIYCSAAAHEGWDVPHRKQVRGHDDLVRIEYVASPRQLGGHAFALVGYNEDGFVLQNSWGKGWGAQGFALLPYEEWVTRGEDAWVFTLGVPSACAAPIERARGTRVLRSPRYFVPSSSSEQSGHNPTERPAGLIASSDSFERRYRAVPSQLQPIDSEAAYRHALVLDRGFLVRNDVTMPNASDAVQRVVYGCPSRWLAKEKSNKLLIYAHGGLNSEADSITRIRALAPYALAEGIYPVFITWRSGPLETLGDLIEETFAKLGFGSRGVRPATGWLDQLTDKTDRLLESILRGPGGALWQQMKLNARRASDHEQGGCRAMVQHLQRLRAERPKLELHLVGHSAGAIVLGALLRQLQRGGLEVASLRLLAPACTTRFALERFEPAVTRGVLPAKHFHIHTLSRKNELDDNVGPYRKSLLHLVSRSFEDLHKMPILGLEDAFDPRTVEPRAEDDVWALGEQKPLRAWIEFWRSLGRDASNRQAHVLSRSSIHTGAGTIRAAHGSFDNDAEVMGDALGYIVDPNRPRRVRIHRLDY